MKKLVLLLASICVISVSNQTVEAAPRGTPTIVTNDSTMPVPVTGIVAVSNTPSYFKPVGITVATISNMSSSYAKSVLCAAEYPASRICTSADLMNSPGKINTAVGAWVMPIPFTDSNWGVDVSGVPYNYNSTTGYGFIIRNNELYYTSTGIGSYPVACCAP